jgi:hypothetical protein
MASDITSFGIASSWFDSLGPPSEWAMRVTVVGSGFMSRALPLVAKVGAQELESLVVLVGDVGFEGYLRQRPNEGDRLYIGYDTPDCATDVTFTAPGAMPVV